MQRSWNARPNRQRRSKASIIMLFGIVAFSGIVWRGCQGLPPNVANCQTTPAAPKNTSVLPSAIEPPPQALCGFPISISVPAEGATVNSPATVVALATPPDQIYWMRLYVDGQAVYYSFTNDINQYIWMPDGAHTVEVVAEDVAGYIANRDHARHRSHAAWRE